jgi:histidinol-phosphate aminotransferase
MIRTKSSVLSALVDIYDRGPYNKRFYFLYITKGHVMKVARDCIFNVKPYAPGKPIEEVQRELGLKEVIKLASNENPYPPSQKVLKAIADAAGNINRYPDGNCFALRKAVAERLGVKGTQLIFGNGSDEIIVLAVKAFVAEGDEVIMARPTFLVYDIASRLAGAKIQAVPLNNFHYDLPAMMSKVNGRTKMIFIGNPDNPAGTYITAKQAAELMEAVGPEVLVLFDEAYFEYVRADDYPDTLAMTQKYPNLLVTRTFSKIYGLAGLRVGYGIAQEGMIDILNRLREPFNVNSLAQVAAIAALSDAAYYKKVAQKIEDQREFLYKALAGLGLSFPKSYTNFCLVPVGQDSTAVAGALLRQGIIVRDMAVWGLNGFIRVSIGTPKENKKFIQCLKKILEAR